VFDLLYVQPKPRRQGSRLVGNQSLDVMIVLLCEGDAEAEKVFYMLIKTWRIDPCAGLPTAWNALALLDELGIYGARIATLHKEICGENIVKTLAVLRAWEFGFVTAAQINAAIDNKSAASIDADRLLALLQRMYPRFGR
jgi:hypothetical protein